MDVGWQELVIILVVVMIIFGAGKLPEIGSSLGKGIREFRSAAEHTAEPSVAARPHATTTSTPASASASIEEL